LATVLRFINLETFKNLSNLILLLSIPFKGIKKKLSKKS